LNVTNDIRYGGLELIKYATSAL